MTGAVQTQAERPVAPGSFSADADGHDTINLTWSNDETSADYDHIDIEFSTDGGDNWNWLARVAFATEAYSHTGLTAEQQYHYRARVRKRFKTTTWSLTDNETTPEEL